MPAINVSWTELMGMDVYTRNKIAQWLADLRQRAAPRH